MALVKVDQLATTVQTLAPFTTVNNGGARPLKGISAAEFALLRNGTLVYVESVRDFYKWNPASTEADDTGAATSLNRYCNPTVNGANPGRLERMFLYSPDWRVQDFFIDSATGHNENDGSFTSPLANDVELYQRWGSECNLENALTVHYAQDPTTITNYNVNIFDNASLTLQGVLTASKTAVAITAVGAHVRTPGAEARHRITGATLGAADVGKLAVIVTGTPGNIGAYAKILKDNGGGQVIVSPFGKGDLGFPGFTQVTPVIGDAVDIVTPTTLLVGAIRIKNMARGPGSFGAPPINTAVFDSVTLDGDNTNFGQGELYLDGLYAQLLRGNLKDINFNGPTTISLAGLLCDGGGIEGTINVSSDGLSLQSSGVLNAAIQVNHGGLFICYIDTYFQASYIITFQGGVVSSAGSAFFDQPLAFINPIMVSYLSSFGQVGTVGDWGTNNVGYGIYVESGCKYVYQVKPSINGLLGAGREASIGGTDKLYAAVPYIEGANGASMVLRA
jgi:hypothetical protein